MREFVRGWRRKAGCATLLMACVFAGGWSRSLHFYNEIHFPVGTHATASVVSTNQFVGMKLTFIEDVPSQWGFYECKAEVTLPLSSTNEDADCNPLSYARDLVWVSEWQGFGMGGNFDELPSFWLMKSMIPYWSIVLSLTLISALLLSKPRQATAPKTLELAANEGT